MDSNITRKLGTMKLVAESLYEFERTGSVHKTLNIGMNQRIENFIENETPYKAQTEPRYQGWRYKTPLWICTRYNQPQFVKYLLQTGADARAHESAALRWACGFGYRDIVAMLLDAGADPDAQGAGYGAETYRWANREGHYDIIDLLDRSKRGDIFFTGEKEPVAKKVQDIVQRGVEEEPESVEEPENKGWI
jgi:hypothetical protein